MNGDPVVNGFYGTILKFTAGDSSLTMSGVSQKCEEIETLRGHCDYYSHTHILIYTYVHIYMYVCI